MVILFWQGRGSSAKVRGEHWSLEMTPGLIRKHRKPGTGRDRKSPVSSPPSEPWLQGSQEMQLLKGGTRPNLSPNPRLQSLTMYLLCAHPMLGLWGNMEEEKSQSESSSRHYVQVLYQKLYLHCLIKSPLITLLYPCFIGEETEALLR